MFTTYGNTTSAILLVLQLGDMSLEEQHLPRPEQALGAAGAAWDPASELPCQLARGGRLGPVSRGQRLPRTKAPPGLVPGLQAGERRVASATAHAPPCAPARGISHSSRHPVCSSPGHQPLLTPSRVLQPRASATPHAIPCAPAPGISHSSRHPVCSSPGHQPLLTPSRVLQPRASATPHAIPCAPAPGISHSSRHPVCSSPGHQPLLTPSRVLQPRASATPHAIPCAPAPGISHSSRHPVCSSPGHQPLLTPSRVLQPRASATPHAIPCAPAPGISHCSRHPVCSSPGRGCQRLPVALTPFWSENRICPGQAGLLASRHHAAGTAWLSLLETLAGYISILLDSLLPRALLLGQGSGESSL
uniref:Uncharacterized protein n=1 Tax=Pelodiscus sinensis TaxID=13735 RepID=K7F1E2_PELSI